MISIEVRGAAELAKKLDAAASGVALASFRNVARATVETRNLLFVGMSAKKVSDSFFGFRSPPGHTLAARTGQTRNMLSPGRVWRLGNESFGQVGHPSPHVKALEDGATVRPKTAQYLRVPLAAALTGSGQDRNVGRSVRGVPGFFIYPSKRQREGGGARTKSLFLAKNVNGKLVLWYLLLREVKLPEKKLFAVTLEQMRPRYLELMGREVAAVIQTAN